MWLHGWVYVAILHWHEYCRWCSVGYIIMILSSLEVADGIGMALPGSSKRWEYNRLLINSRSLLDGLPEHGTTILWRWYSWISLIRRKGMHPCPWTQLLESGFYCQRVELAYNEFFERYLVNLVGRAAQHLFSPKLYAEQLVSIKKYSDPFGISTLNFSEYYLTPILLNLAELIDLIKFHTQGSLW